MPFKSEKQRRYLWLKHPDIAKRWADNYPTKKDLPMYAPKDKERGEGDEKQSAAQILNAYLPKCLERLPNYAPSANLAGNTKQSDSKQEYVKLPVKHGPTFAGETEAQAVDKPVEDGVNDTNEPTPEKRDELTADALFKKLSVVLSPRLMQELEDEQARQQARAAQRIPQNVGIKRLPPAVNSILPPMGMAQPAPNPGQTQPAQPQQQAQPAHGQLASVGGGNSPNANPINAFGGLSSTGDINGNAALGTQNAVGGEKMSARKCSCGCGDTPKTCTCPAQCSCRKPGGSCFAEKPAEKQSTETQLCAAVEKWAGKRLGLWDRIRMKRERGEKPATPGDADYPDSKSWQKVTKSSAAKLAADIDFGSILRNSLTKKPTPPPTVEKSLGRAVTNILWQGMQPPQQPAPTATAMPCPWGRCTPPAPVPTPSLTMKASASYANESSVLADLINMGATMFPDPDDTDLDDDERTKQAGSPAWQRSAGKSETGGLNAKGRASYNRATGGNLKAPVTEKNPTGKAKARRRSFCSRMCGMKRVNTGAKTKSDPDSRINKALRKWNCKCSSDKQADFDPNMSRDAENAIMHGTGLVGSGAIGTVAGLPFSAGLEALMQSNNLLPDADKHPIRNIFAQSLIRSPMLVGGMLGMRAYDNYIMRPYMRREDERKKQEMLAALSAGLQHTKTAADPSLERVLSTALVSAGGGLALGAYPGMKLQRASERAGNPELVSFVAGKAPIAVGSALSAGLYNHWRDRHEKKPKQKVEPADPSSLRYLQYLVH